ncbi:sarcosine oxidase subunit delta [Methylobacterium durans]|jgi:sarcosine oxidase subunit delta|uniref:Sarcosine oxidase subunit delta n=1 Tax=Methylobacterium durans TaxID=2202825 RepID=A0A2U8W279_9HYPH|nr:sarcosine oxidase subunit delta [Methylobacterium durans]AWN40195.1 sarcosine oxidase subunit delta [Methylobacterium durans]
MRIRCPHCGERDNGEFSYLGDAAPVRPDGMEAEAGAMHDYVYLRDNRAGEIRELWYHGAGCRSWLIVTRDTRTHAISDVSPARDVALARRRGDAA